MDSVSNQYLLFCKSSLETLTKGPSHCHTEAKRLGNLFPIGNKKAKEISSSSGRDLHIPIDRKPSPHPSYSFNIL